MARLVDTRPNRYQRMRYCLPDWNATPRWAVPGQRVVMPSHNLEGTIVEDCPAHGGVLVAVDGGITGGFGYCEVVPKFENPASPALPGS